MRRHTRILWIIVLVGIGAFSSASAWAAAPVCSFKNPLMIAGQDPSVVFHDGFYYLVQSNNSDFSIGIRRAQYLTELGTAENVKIWSAPTNTNYSREVWAPEIVFLQGHFYIYFAADDGDNNNHRMFALKATTDDPLGPWEFMGPMFKTPELDKWAIDLSAFEYNDSLYAIWSGSPGDEAGAVFPQVLYIAEMDNPTSVSGLRVEILVPTEPWESTVQPIAEGPEPYIHDDTLSIVYSADASWSRHYKLAVVKLEGDDPLDAEAWVKVGPVFSEIETDQGGVYGVGHNSIPVTSPDGSEWWNVYHSKAKPADGWEDRDIRIQQMTWNTDGTPNFGTPIPASVAQPVPSGEPCGLQMNVTFDEGYTEFTSDPHITMQGDPSFVIDTTNIGPQGVSTSDLNLVLTMDGDDVVDLGHPLVNTTGSYTVTARVWLTEIGGDYTIAAQEGGLFSAFRLRITEEGYAAFTTYDARGDVAAEVQSVEPLNSNSWYALAVVRDAITGDIALYVNGTLAATAPFHDDWVSLKSFVIGAAKEKGKRQHFLIGSVDDVSVYKGALTAEDITAQQ